jgi:hypothetical protein
VWEKPALIPENFENAKVLAVEKELTPRPEATAKMKTPRKPADDTEAALFIQRAWRTRVAREQVSQLVKSLFEKYWDEDYQCYYYYNKKSGETTWSKPKLLKDDINPSQ